MHSNGKWQSVEQGVKEIVQRAGPDDTISIITLSGPDDTSHNRAGGAWTRAVGMSQQQATRYLADGALSVAEGTNEDFTGGFRAAERILQRMHLDREKPIIVFMTKGHRFYLPDMRTFSMIGFHEQKRHKKSACQGGKIDAPLLARLRSSL